MKKNFECEPAASNKELSAAKAKEFMLRLLKKNKPKIVKEKMKREESSQKRETDMVFTPKNTHHHVHNMEWEKKKDCHYGNHFVSSNCYVLPRDSTSPQDEIQTEKESIPKAPESIYILHSNRQRQDQSEKPKNDIFHPRPPLCSSSVSPRPEKTRSSKLMKLKRYTNEKLLDMKTVQQILDYRNKVLEDQSKQKPLTATTNSVPSLPKIFRPYPNLKLDTELRMRQTFSQPTTLMNKVDNVKENKELHNKISIQPSSDRASREDKLIKPLSANYPQQIHAREKLYNVNHLTLFQPSIKSQKPELAPPIMLKERIRAFAIKTKVGKSSSKPNKGNQDSSISLYPFCGVPCLYFFGVFDGHGLFGGQASGFVKRQLPLNIEKFQSIPDLQDKSTSKFFINKTIRQNIIKAAFERTNKELKNSDLDVNYSGTTACTIIIGGDFLITANLGDSRAIMGTYRTGVKLDVIELTQDHKPNHPTELERIVKSNGRVECYQDKNGNPVGPHRVWRKNMNLPGLAMSRSFGDKIAHEVGVISSPDICERRIESSDKVIVLASDGIWEVLSNERVMDILYPHWISQDANTACQKLIEEATKEWGKGSGADDITCIVIFLNSPL